MEQNRIKVGVGVMVIKQGKVLLGVRQNTHGGGEYAFPGGHLEFGESFEECAHRECREEVGIEIKNIKTLRISNLRQYGKHYVDIGVVAHWKSGEPEVLESDKISNWGWYEMDNLPQPLFGHIKYTIEAYQTGRVFFDD